MARTMEVVVSLAEQNCQRLVSMVQDIPAEKMCVQPPGLPNHAAWQLGHLATTRMQMSQVLGQPGELPETWPALFGPGSRPTSEVSAYPSKQELIEAVQRLQAHVAGLVRGLGDEQLDAEHGFEALKGIWPTVRHLVVALFTLHDGLHLGQLGDWRRAARVAG